MIWWFRRFDTIPDCDSITDSRSRIIHFFAIKRTLKYSSDVNFILNMRNTLNFISRVRMRCCAEQDIAIAILSVRLYCKILSR